MNDSNDGWVLLARVVKPQGRRGEVLADIFTDFPQAFSSRERVFLRPPASLPSQPLKESKVQSHWLHKDRVVLKFAQVDSIEAAEQLRGCDVLVPRDERMPLADDAVYISDLIGALVVDVNPAGVGVAGEIIDVEPEAVGPAMLVLRTPSGDERLVPFVRAYLRSIDLPAKRVAMDLPLGLLAMQGPVAGPGEEDAQEAPEPAEEMDE